MKTAVITLLVCWISSAYCQANSNPQKSAAKKLGAVAGTLENPLFVKREKTQDEKNGDAQQEAREVKNLQIQADSLQVSKEALVASKDTLQETARAASAAVGATAIAGLAAAFALAAAIIAWYQFQMFSKQLALMRISNRTAARAANAALAQSESIRDAERAYVKMFHESPGVKWGDAPREMSVSIKAANYGNTIADLQRIVVNVMTIPSGESAPVEPQYAGGDAWELTHAILVKSDFVMTTRTFILTEDEFEGVRTGDRIMFIIGFAEYMDKFGRLHHGGYARVYDRNILPPQNNLALVTVPGYNYDREVKAPKN